MSESVSRPATRTRVAAVIVTTLTAAVGRGVGGSPAQLDARFVATMRADGHDLPQGADDELDAVSEAFSGDARRFAALALETYCPS